jgi:hypothetical protein
LIKDPPWVRLTRITAVSEEQLLSDEAFRSLLASRTRELLGLALYVRRHFGQRGCFTKPLLAALLSEATTVEELLDAFGVRHNRRWYPLRTAVALLKLFSRVSYLLLHILHFLPTYSLLPIEGNFERATRRTLSFTCSVVGRGTGALLRTVQALGIEAPPAMPSPETFAERLPKGSLPFDRESLKVASPEETVVHLATAFLNLAEESRFLHIGPKEPGQSYADWIPDPISEERLRTLEQKFHNLQSLYDTHISDSNVESLDRDLRVLRGHITVIFHLLETATCMAHYCERHILSFSRQGTGDRGGAAMRCPAGVVDPVRLLQALIDYSLAFASRYILRTRGLCHDMLRRYAIQGRISVPVPPYRGFHVRPSTLIARIVSHYGSEVTMELEGEQYNAGITLDLFRANEKLNARKRRQLAEEVDALGLGGGWPPEEQPTELVRKAVQVLFSQNRLVIYDRNLPLSEARPLEGESQEAFVTRTLVQLLTMGKLDVETDSSVGFLGDRRVLEDIRLLAQNGYGEDAFGNNLPLPQKLAYLRR